VAYPEPDVTTRAQQLSSAAENLRIHALDLQQAFVTPSAETLCDDLRDVAERISDFAATLTQTTAG
jgi:hypothetical protein